MSAEPEKKARLFRVRPTLADQIRLPGGRKVAAAVASAEAALDEHRDAAVAAMARMVEELEVLCRAPSDADFDRVYPLASSLAGTAGFFDTGPFYHAAYSLCELAEKLAAAGRRDWASVEVHARALRLMLADGFRDSEETRLMLEGLSALVRRLEA